MLSTKLAPQTSQASAGRAILFLETRKRREPRGSCLNHSTHSPFARFTSQSVTLVALQFSHHVVCWSNITSVSGCCSRGCLCPNLYGASERMRGPRDFFLETRKLREPRDSCRYYSIFVAASLFIPHMSFTRIAFTWVMTEIEAVSWLFVRRTRRHLVPGSDGLRGPRDFFSGNPQTARAARAIHRSDHTVGDETTQTFSPSFDLSISSLTRVHLKRMPDLSSYKVGVVLSVEDCGSSKGKSLRACKVNVGDEDDPITVVTAASNVRQGSRQVIVVHNNGRWLTKEHYTVKLKSE